VMGPSRATIDARYKRRKDQMARRLAEGDYARGPRAADPLVLTPAVRAELQRLLPVPSARLHDALLQPGAKRRALLGLVLLNYARFLCSLEELANLAKTPGSDVETASLSVLREVAERTAAEKTP